MARCGRILEHHTDTGVVAIDIGSSVQVRPGQEFLVFHPSFAGGTPFVFSDGRSKKRLGDYPRLPYGRIVAFAVQKEVSFCKVSEQPLSKAFAVGSELEAVPLGAITHLIPAAAASVGGGLATPEVVEQFVRRTLDDRGWAFAAILSPRKLQDVLERLGSAYVNQTLGRLYEALRSTLPRDSAISLIQQADILAVSRTNSESASDQLETRVRQVLEDLNRQLDSSGEFVAGIYFRQGDGKLTSADILDAARYAASVVSSKDTTIVERFSSDTATAVLTRQRQAQRFQDALKDYSRFVALGVESLSMHNLAGLCALDTRDETRNSVALEAFSKALALSPENEIVAGNLATAKILGGEEREAFSLFRNGVCKESLFHENSVYAVCFAVAALRAWKNDSTILTVGELRDVVSYALTFGPSIPLTPKNYHAELNSGLVNLAGVEPAADVDNAK